MCEPVTAAVEMAMDAVWISNLEAVMGIEPERLFPGLKTFLGESMAC